jgi:hypothetical protein
MKAQYLLLLCFVLTSVHLAAQTPRADVLLNSNWRTAADEKNPIAFQGFETPSFNDRNWKLVDIPHNWDDYAGYRSEKHGNKHGYAWYRHNFQLTSKAKDRQYFLWFEGVGSYATVWLNGQEVGRHAGGRTSFTINVTRFIKKGNNLLAVKAGHPVGIQDLPWVCGGCSPEYGFSEGSQPMGVFRPVHLISTAPVRVEPFGIHIWNNRDISEKSAILHLTTEIKNYGSKPVRITVANRLLDSKNNVITEVKNQSQLDPGKSEILQNTTSNISNPHLWSPEDPYLYQLVTEVTIGNKIVDVTSTSYGIRWISWPDGKSGKQFLVNGKPVFINGVAEYEHLLGQSHAFSKEQIHTRIMQVKAAGFNAFRDAHQPHNLRYQEYWDKLGILWWPQFAAHIWYDTPGFRDNFKTLLRDWVKERRNSPSVILWGLENESTLPRSFAEECVAIIREMDPTTSSQRKITTCNGGKGTDWDVPQNWTGTYGGNPFHYAEDLKKHLLFGEYGAWRSIDRHAEPPFGENASGCEDTMAQLMELKIRLANSVKNDVCGHFHWLLNSHENPGRFQSGEGFRNIDKIGPVNYKGLFTLWDEPTDAFYLYRSNFVSKDKEPMVYIVSHTWPNRWLAPGIKSGIMVYSNCDEVELFNDIKSVSLGKRTRNGIGTHFQWDSVPVSYNVLYAQGYVNGKMVATDCVVLNHLPEPPNFKTLLPEKDTVLQPVKGYHYLYRVNCGGPEYKDHNGNVWLADVAAKGSIAWGSNTWSDDYSNLPEYFASQRRVFNPIKGSLDWLLFQTFRYGRHKLQYEFPLPDGDYLIELYFTEPWYGSSTINGEGWRVFDIAVNDSIVLKDLDIYKEAGHDCAFRKTLKARVKGGKLIISFPKVKSGQAIISAIAIASQKSNIRPASASVGLIKDLMVAGTGSDWSLQSWMGTGDKQYNNKPCSFSALPQELYGSEWIRTSDKESSHEVSTPLATFSLTSDAYVYIAIDAKVKTLPLWLNNWTLTNLFLVSDDKGGTTYKLYKKYFTKDQKIDLFGNGVSDEKLSMYTVIVHKESVLEQPAPVVRPAIVYEAEDADIGSAIKDTLVKGFEAKGYVVFGNSTADTIDWNIHLGVGDTYGLRFRYKNISNSDIVARIAVIASDGNVLNQGTIYFSPSTEEWDKVSTTTGTSVNAGDYKIQLAIPNAKGLLIDNLKVQ